MKQALRARGAISYREIRREFGNGDEKAGKVLLEDIALRLRHARSKHPVFATSREEAVDVIGSEWAEIAQAVEQNEGPERERYETIDTIATCVRKANGEDRKATP